MEGYPTAAAPYRVKLSDIFEGPMDLLVHLIKKNEINIYDIPIARVAEQFLARIRTLGLNDAADYLDAMRRLVPIKSDAPLEVWTGERDDEIANELAEVNGLRGPLQRLRAALAGSIDGSGEAPRS